MKKLKAFVDTYIPFICTILAIGFMALPNAFVSAWASPYPETRYDYRSYFDLLLYGYGIVFPFITEVIVTIGAVFLFLRIKWGKFKKTALILTTIGLITSIVSFIWSLKTTAPGVIASILLLASVLYQKSRLHEK